MPLSNMTVLHDELDLFQGVVGEHRIGVEEDKNAAAGGGGPRIHLASPPRGRGNWQLRGRGGARIS